MTISLSIPDWCIGILLGLFFGYVVVKIFEIIMTWRLRRLQAKKETGESLI